MAVKELWKSIYLAAFNDHELNHRCPGCCFSIVIVAEKDVVVFLLSRATFHVELTQLHTYSKHNNDDDEDVIDDNKSEPVP